VISGGNHTPIYQFDRFALVWDRSGRTDFGAKNTSSNTFLGRRINRYSNEYADCLCRRCELASDFYEFKSFPVAALRSESEEFNAAMVSAPMLEFLISSGYVEMKDGTTVVTGNGLDALGSDGTTPPLTPNAV
jgi:hypothetical protein